VGRTDKVSGSATLEESGDKVIVKAATFTADVTTLQSDQGRRDSVIKNRGLESNKFKSATFTLSDPPSPGRGARPMQSATCRSTASRRR
jgi:hypothetical protein